MILCKFYEDCGRMGDLEGLFICSREEYDLAMGKSAYLDEPLGKYSEYDVVLTTENVEIIEFDETALRVLEKALGKNISGFNIVEIALDQWEELNEHEEDEYEDNI